MKSLSKFAGLAVGVSVLAVSALGLSHSVFADSPGQLEVGPSVYEVRDLTQNGSYAGTISANAGDELVYSVELHNTEFDTLDNIQVNVNLPSASNTSNSSTMTATTANGGTSGTNGTALVNLPSAETISYVAGSAQLFSSTGSVIENLPDTITTTGVNVGNLIGSTTEYVNFEAKVSKPAPAPTPTPTPVYTCNLLSLTEPAGTTKQIQANVEYTATNGATFTNVTFNFGDGVIANSVAGVTSINHTYANYGTYNVTATAYFEVNGSSQSATNTACTQTVSFAAPATPAAPTTPAATPTQLVNTGPGDVIALFGGVTVLGAVAHRLFGRRLVSLFVR